MRKSATLKSIVTILLINSIFAGPILAFGNTGTIDKNKRNPIVRPAVTNSRSSAKKPLQDENKAGFNPRKIESGATQPIVITLINCKTGWVGGTFMVDPTSIGQMEQVGIRIKNFQAIGAIETGGMCRSFAEIVVSKGTAAGKYPVKIGVVGAEDPSQQLEVEIIGNVGLERGRVPPGLDPEYQVDIMWAVVPKKIAKDNFGPLVARRFYCIEVVIGNNSGFDLQISAVGFRPGPVGRYAEAMADTHMKLAARQAAAAQQQAEDSDRTLKEKLQYCEDEKRDKKLTYLQCIQRKTSEVVQDMARTPENDVYFAAAKNQAQISTAASHLIYGDIIPVTSYPIARGTASHGQLINIRSISLGVLRALGPILTGITPMLDVKSQKGNYSNLVNVITNPLTEGFSAAWPDETISRLQRLDDQILRDGMIINNNRQMRTRTFIPKELLHIKDKKLRNDPTVVTQALGEIVLIGNQIKFLNRVSVTSGPSGELNAPPTINPTGPIPVSKGTTSIVTVTGTALEGALITSSDPNIEVTNTNSNKTSASATINVKSRAEIRSYTLTLTTARGSVPFEVVVMQAPVNNLAIDPAHKNILLSLQPTEKSYTIRITGDNLKKAKIFSTDNPDKPLIVNEVLNPVGEEGTAADIVVKVPAGALKHTYKFKVVNTGLGPNSPGAELELEVVDRKPSPTANPDQISFPAGTEPRANPLLERIFDFKLKGTNLTYLRKDVVVSCAEKENVLVQVDPNVLDTDPSPLIHLIVRPGVSITSDSGDKCTFGIPDIDGQVVIFSTLIRPQAPIKVTAPPQPVTIENAVTITGQNLEGFQAETSSPNWEVAFTPPAIGTDGSVTAPTITIKPKSDTAPDAPLTVKVRFTNSNAKVQEMDIVLKRPS